MHDVQIFPEHWFRRFYPWFLLFARVQCRCGWKTRPHLSLDAAASEFVYHQIVTGKRSTPC